MKDEESSRKRFQKIYRQVRKPMPPHEKTIMPKERYERNNDWRREIDEEDDGEDYKPIGGQDVHNDRQT